MPPADENKVAEMLAATNAILSQFIPLIGVSFTTFSLVRELFKRSGGDIGPFAEEIAKHEAARAQVRASIDEFYARFGRPGEPVPSTPPSGGGSGPIVPPSPEGPPPGATTRIGE